MPAPRHSSIRLLAALALGLVALAGSMLLVHGIGPDPLRLVIRTTARTSLLLFLLAFTASALAALGPAGALGWPRRNRRALGLAFATSHAVHLAAIVALARLHPEAYLAASTGSPVPGAVAYALLAAMAATSNDRAIAWMGPRAWRALHLAGGLYLWVSFTVAFARRLPRSPG